jgi:glutathionylspermidine synthase
MRRLPVHPRPDWRRKLESIGFLFHTLDGVYWNEAACYTLTMAEVDTIEDASNALHRLCLAAVDHVIEHNLFARLAIAEHLVPWIRSSWEKQEPSLYGRFDFAYHGPDAIKLLEYNADTPTALFEASVAQWYWLQEHDPARDQFNAIHEQLIARWRELAARLPAAERVHFACLHDHIEDYVTTEYLRDTAAQAGLDTASLDMADLGYHDRRGEFVDMDNRAIRTLFKLYPWEWMVAETFGPKLLRQPWRTLEPPWKMILANKGILAVLWDLYPNHPHLLPAYFDAAPLGNRYARKPLLSREGANITLCDNGRRIESPGKYGHEGFVYQALCPLPVFDGNHAVIGSWIVGNRAAGIGIREDDDPITRNTSRFVPHYINPQP